MSSYTPRGTLLVLTLYLSWLSTSLTAQNACCGAFDYPVMLEFMYLGDDCQASFNSQAASSCFDFGNGPSDFSEIFVKICAGEDHNNPANVWKKTIANLGSSFFFTNLDIGHDHIPEWTHIFIFADASETRLLQHIRIQSSCAVPLELGDQWGAIRLVAIEGLKGGHCRSNLGTLLPLSFVYFGATQKKHSIEISWGVSTELFEGKMEVQRSVEGRYFNALATFSTSSVSGVSDYTFVDQNPSANDNYYRLKVFNADGSSTYSQIETIHYASETEKLMFPNPVSSDLQLANIGEIHGLEVFNSMGQPQSDITISNDFSRIDMAHLPSGMYYVIIHGKNHKTIQAIIKN